VKLLNFAKVESAPKIGLTVIFANNKKNATQPTLQKLNQLTILEKYCTTTLQSCEVCKLKSINLINLSKYSLKLNSYNKYILTFVYSF